MARTQAFKAFFVARSRLLAFLAGAVAALTVGVTDVTDVVGVTDVADVVPGPRRSPTEVAALNSSGERFDPRHARCGTAGDGAESQPLGEPWPHPVQAPIVDWFRPPSNPYGPGNRGLEYGTASGDQVVAITGGTVAFAGPVGGTRFLAVIEPGGLRITYGYLETTAVEPGDELSSGQPVATAGPGLHLTVRDRGRYIDPLPLLVGYRCFVVRLVALPAES
jgi:murein DD-endopeptidase MepM/ murein hydrolase activator NlpD